jgi:predicted NUDIX family NTP pyrophosphohydrolase
VAKRSAGLVIYRRRDSGIEVFLVHPGGPFWMKKDIGAWSIPKGEYDESEDALTAAKREVEEETGAKVEGNFLALGEVRQRGGKIVTAWAIEADVDERSVKSNTFSLEWPPRSGRIQEFPEVDRGGWFTVASARTKLVTGQIAFIERLLEKLGIFSSGGL